MLNGVRGEVKKKISVLLLDEAHIKSFSFVYFSVLGLEHKVEQHLTAVICPWKSCMWATGVTPHYTRF